MRIIKFNTIQRAPLILLIFSMGVILMAQNSQAYESAYPKTPSGKIEIKIIPESKLLATENPGNYFDSNNQLFTRLFNYISTNEVSMTVPVEADMDNARMKFYVGSQDRVKDLQNQGPVKIITVPQRTVVSIGMKGSYTKARFEKGKEKLLAWLRDNPRFCPAGEAYAVYWDAPFVPWFLKHSEVHIAVTEQK
jgi:DNA gyrase inhibitor GyrI